MIDQEPGDWAEKATVRNPALPHQIGFQTPKRGTAKTGMGVVVTCNCSWHSSRCIESLKDAWDLYLDHDYLYRPLVAQ